MAKQTVFTKKGQLDIPPDEDSNLTAEDRVLMVKLKRKKVICPYCLYYGSLWEFTTRLKHKRGKHFISTSKCRCPDCDQSYMKRTLLRIADMSMEEYANWFWGAIFSQWGIYDQVSWDKMKWRMEGHYDYEVRQEFWEIYWEFKDASDGGKARADKDAYEDYKKTWLETHPEDTP